ncbi:CAP domain-containing protein [Cytobacillus kochii]|uniref:CAP domain-containing protein n=1 Tax=Cytobacillus kochii TaxID=859143 RepID=UPI00203B0680|nr:CAP domain-containing protein [Cytobacillus kochii]MCM3320948.1 CAP domain-containing protein [Cytobacillus kochii]MCM3344219.1 CAP domain-containing protein [Cytobacillus kochii]
MSKKVIFSVAAAAALLVSAPGLNKAEAAEPAQVKVDTKAFVYQTSNMLNQDYINKVMQDCMGKYNVNWNQEDIQNILSQAKEKAQAALEQGKAHAAQPEQAEQPAKEAAQPEKQPAKEAAQPEKQPAEEVAQPEKQPAEEAAQPEKQPEQEVTEEAQAPSEEASSEVSAYEQQVLDLTNKERANAGLPALKLDVELSKVAREKSRDMQAKGYFDHNSPTYGSPFDMMKQFGISYTSAGENIAQGQQTPEEVVQAWMNSQGHRENILNSSYTHLGVGYVENGNYWTQMFIGK